MRTIMTFVVIETRKSAELVMHGIANSRTFACTLSACFSLVGPLLMFSFSMTSAEKLILKNRSSTLAAPY